MRSLQLFCLGLAVMASALAGETTVAVDRNPPPVFARNIAGLLTKYGDVEAGRTAFPQGEQDEIVLVSETVQFRDADGTRYCARHQIYHAAAASAVERLGSSVYSFDRERESIFLVDAATILPDGRRLPVAGKGAFIQTPQHEAENSLYTSQAELNLVFPGVVAGASTEAIVLTRENVPVMPGEFCSEFSFFAGWPTFLRRLVVELPDAGWRRVHALNSGPAIGEPCIEIPAAGRTRKTWTRRLIPMMPSEEGAPSYIFRAPTLWLTTLKGWDDVAGWFHRLASERSELGPGLTAEVNRITAGMTGARRIIDALCTAVANDVRYTGLEFGLAGYQPSPCRDVWEHRYGDCKDKANLLRAMLAQKGIRSHLALLETGSLGYVERGSPSWRQFNHCILAVEDGAGGYMFCDPTIKYLPAGVLGAYDRARDILVENDGRAEWVRTPDALDSAVRIAADLKLAPDGELSGWYTLAGEGSSAAYYADYYNSMDKDDRQRDVQGYVESFFPGASVFDIDFQPPAGSVSRIQLRAYLRRPPRANGGESMSFPYPAGWLPSVETNGERKCAYGGTLHREESVDVRIALPAGWNAGALPAAFNAASDAADFAASWSAKDGVVEAHLRWAPRKSELSPAEYGVFQRSVRALAAWLAQPVSIAPAPSVPAAVTAAAPALDRFPILATGEGQLRLLDEEFPAGKDDERRRAALEQVIQWFPNDAETVFDARVKLLLLDEERMGGRAYADGLASLLASHGNRVSAAARAWAEYLEAVARWHDNKSRAALDSLRRMAADTSLPPFRRGWAAYEAARCMAENKPGAAADFLLPYCGMDSNAQDDSECLVAICRIQTADGKGLARFLAKLPDRHRANPSGIMEKLMDAVAERWPGFTPAGRAAALDAFGRALVPPDRFPKAFDTMAGLRRWVEADAARRRCTDELGGWLRSHPTKLWTGGKPAQYADADAAIKAIEAANKEGDPARLVAAELELVLRCDPQFPAFAKYTDWAIWWLGKNHLADELFEKLGTLALQLPPETSEDVVECWQDFAMALARRGDAKRAGEIMERIVETAAAKDFQKVAAGGELGRMALNAGDADRALGCFRKIEPIHTSNKYGVDYLYTALLIELERGNLDRGLEIVAHIGEQQPKFIKEAGNSREIEPLLRAALKPEALKHYWQRQAKWRPQWDNLIRGAGLTPPPFNGPPVKVEWSTRADRIAKAVAARDAKEYLRLLDEAVRVAQWLPAAVNNVQDDVDGCDPFPSEFQNGLRACALAMVADWNSVDSEADETARMWEAVLLLDLGRKTEAAARGRALYARIGADSNAGETALRVWVIASRGSADEPEAIAALDRLCALDRALSNRMHSVRVLSDSLMLRGDAVADLVLLERETARPGFDRTCDDGKALLTRLDQLRERHAAADALTKIISGWKDRYCSNWFDLVGPGGLDDPRCAGIKEPMTSSQAGFAEAERAKFNLLFALDERQDSEHREKAFFDAALLVSQATHDVGRCTDMLLDCAGNQKLGLGIRKGFLTWAFFISAEPRRIDLLERCLKEEVFAALPKNSRDSFSAVLEAFKLSAEKRVDKSAGAFRLLAGAPIDYTRSYFGGQVLCGMAVAGQAAAADELLAGAATPAIDQSFEATPAGVRLQWTRNLRNAEQIAPLIRRLGTIIGGIPAAGGAPDKRLSERDVTEPDESLDLTAAEDAVMAGLRLRSAANGDDVREAIDWLRPAMNEHLAPPDFGADVFDAVFATGLDDAVKASLLSPAFSLCDVDVPHVIGRVDALAKAFLASPDALKQPETARAMATIRALIALRTSKEDRPDPLFGPVATTRLPLQRRRQFQLLFHFSRGNWAECDSIISTLDAEEVKSPEILAIVKASLDRNQRAAEIPAYEDVARESARRYLAAAWFDPADASATSMLSSYVEHGGMVGLIPDALVDVLLARCRNALRGDMLRELRARVRGNWNDALRACDDILALSPTIYSYNFRRAEARHALGQDPEAGKDLEVFLAHALDDFHYQEALRMQKALCRASAESLRPQGSIPPAKITAGKPAHP